MSITVEKKTYPDGSFYPIVKGIPDDSDFTFRINSYNDLWFLNQIKNVLDGVNANLHLTIPCLLDAQHDRKFTLNDSHNLKLMCKFINDMRWKKISIFHPHNQEAVEMGIDNVHIIDNRDFMDTVLGYIQLSEPYDDKDIQKELILMSTDAGGFKPLMKLADKLKWEGETESAAKSRKFVDGKSILEQRIDRHDFGSKDVLIVDDICIYGGTFLGLAKLLRERNVGRLFLAVSHITIQEPNPALWTAFDKVFTTNSKGLRYHYFDERVQGMMIPTNLEVIKLFED